MIAGQETACDCPCYLRTPDPPVTAHRHFDDTMPSLGRFHHHLDWPAIGLVCHLQRLERGLGQSAKRTDICQGDAIEEPPQADATRLIATTEPVLAGVLRIEGFVGPACGRSTVRVAPDGRVLPCTYWPHSHLTLADLQGLGENITHTPEFRAASHAPSACDGCPCRGGCAGRRAVLGDLQASDPYCPFARHDHIVLDWEQVPYEDLPKVGSACTTVVSAK